MDSHLKTQAANDEITAYAARIAIQKKWALIGIVVLAICTVLSMVVLGGMALTLRDKAMTRLSTLVTIVVLAFPYVGLALQATEYRRLSGLLELMDVLLRATSKSEPMNQDT